MVVWSDTYVWRASTVYVHIWYLGALRYGYENTRYVLKSTYVLILSVRTSQLWLKIRSFCSSTYNFENTIYAFGVIFIQEWTERTKKIKKTSIIASSYHQHPRNTNGLILRHERPSLSISLDDTEDATTNCSSSCCSRLCVSLVRDEEVDIHKQDDTNTEPTLKFENNNCFNSSLSFIFSSTSHPIIIKHKRYPWNRSF